MKLNFEKLHHSEKGSSEKSKAVSMYLDDKTVEDFAQRAKEDKKDHDVVSNIIDNTVTKLFKEKDIKIANLGAGANPQKYNGILKKIEEGSKMDWVDISPKMLEIAEQEIDFDENSIEFIKNDFIGYLESQKDESLDCVIIQYAINYIDNLERYFEVLSKKLKEDGAFIANLGGKVLENGEKVSFLVNNQEITGKTELIEGDHYTINFLNPDGTISASTTKNFYTDEEIESASENHGLTPKIGNIDGVNMLIVQK